MARAIAMLAVASPMGAAARNSLSRTPPMGWMSWEVFRCDIDCSKDAGSCISEWLYRNQTDELFKGGYVEAGYRGIHIDDCWMKKDNASGAAWRADPDRFPSGMEAVGEYMHERGVAFGLYTAESPTTCAAYPASKGWERQHAALFAQWGVDYMKVDGCGDPKYYEEGYKAMGAALEASGRQIEYSCSWPAYIGDDESTKPFSKFIMSGCNSWRNWADIDCNWGSLSGIIDHWGDFGAVLAPFAGPGHWHDMDMLLAGANCISLEEEKTQLALWSISASPMIMGNDLRKVPAASRELLLNPNMIAVSQDPLGQMGVRLPNFTSKSPQQIWARNLVNGDVAVGLYNKLGKTGHAELGAAPCPSWHELRGGRRLEACGGGGGDFLLRRFSREAVSAMDLGEVRRACCEDPLCAGFTLSAPGQRPAYDARAAMGCATPPLGDGAADITVTFADLNLFGKVVVFDIWANKFLGEFADAFTARRVPLHGTAFLRMSPVAPPTGSRGPAPVVV